MKPTRCTGPTGIRSVAEHTATTCHSHSLDLEGAISSTDLRFDSDSRAMRPISKYRFEELWVQAGEPVSAL